jgi:hypothetical protein
MHHNGHPMTHIPSQATPEATPIAPKVRSRYERPALRRLGSVRDLTLGGGGSGGDTGNMAVKTGIR